MSGADKLGYLIRALSRTKRKDYENYVVNAIWNRLGDGRRCQAGHATAGVVA